MAGSYYVQLPAYQVPAGINWEPLNQAIDSWTQQNNRNALIALQNKEFDANQKQRDFENARVTKQDHYALIERGARQANAIAQMPAGSPERSAAWAAHIADHRRDFPDEELTPEELDPITGPKIYASAAGLALESPGAVALRNAQIDEAKASAAKSYADVAASRRQADLIKSFMPEYFGDQPAQPGQPTNALMPSQSPSSAPAEYFTPTNALAPPPQNNALMAYGGSPDASSEPTNALLPGISGQAARAISTSRYRPQPASTLRGPAQGGDTSAIPGISVSPLAPSTSLPAPGDPTSFTGDSASGMTTPSRISADTKRAMAYDLALNNGKGMSAILNNDPGSKYATRYAEKTAEDNAAINMKQKMTLPMLDIVHGMREKIAAAGSDIADMATGPDYGKTSDDPTWLEAGAKAFLPDTSGEFYQNARAAVREGLNDTLGYIPAFSGWTQGLADRGYKARDLNLELHHLVKGIGAGVKAIPGTKGGGTSTDADQALVLDAVGEAMHAGNGKTRDNILYDAENILRARAGMPRLPPPDGYTPSAYAAKVDEILAGAPSSNGRAPNTGAATAIAGARAAIQKGADPAAVRQRLIQNGINPDGL